jgi:hypothetical protein
MLMLIVVLMLMGTTKFADKRVRATTMTLECAVK